MTVTFRLLEMDGTEWLDTREYDHTKPIGLIDMIQEDAEAWAADREGELSWWIDRVEGSGQE